MLTQASARRFIEYQKRANPDVPPRLWDRYCVYVFSVDNPDTFAEWVTR